MKKFKQFLSESITINGDFNGTLNVGDSHQEQTKEENSFYADLVWEGKIYRIQFMTNENILPTPANLANQLQDEYPGGIVHNVYPITEKNKNYRVKSVQRYQPEALTWKTES